MAFGCVALVSNVSLVTAFVYKVDVSLPVFGGACPQQLNGSTGLPLTLSVGDQPIGPFFFLPERQADYT